MTEAIKRLLKRYNDESGLGAPGSYYRAIDFFSRTGEWVTVHFATSCKNITCCEINKDYIDALQNNIPNAEIQIGDSFRFVEEAGPHDLVLADCPQGIYGPDGAYSEHFEFFPKIARSFGDATTLFFNVNMYPYVNPEHAAARPDNYGMSDFDRWFQRRDAFYGVDASNLDEEFTRNFYKEYFAKAGYGLDMLTIEMEPSNLPNHPDFIARCLARLSRI